MKKKNLFSLLIISSTFALAGGVLSSNLGFNSPKTVMAEESTPTYVDKVYSISGTDFVKTASKTETTFEKGDMSFASLNVIRADFNGNPQFNMEKSSYLRNTKAFVNGITKIEFTLAISYNNSNCLEVSFGNDDTITGESAKYSTTSSKSGQTITVTPKATGYQYFKASQLMTNYNLKFKTISVYTKEEEKKDPVTSIELNTSTIDLKVSETHKLTATVLPSTAKQDVTYKSSDTSIASVDTDGTIVALKKGTATITATTVAKDSDGKTKEATCTVNVTNDATIASLRDDKGNFKTVLSGKKMTLSGVITSIDTVQKLITIEDNGKAILLYKMDDVTGYKVGDKVSTSGTITTYGGLLEMSGTTKKTVIVDGTGDIPDPTVLEKTDSTSLLGMDSIVFKATGKVGTTTTAKSGDRSTDFTLINGKKITLFTKSAVYTKLGNAFSTYLNKLGTKGTVTFTLPLGWYNKPQLSMLPDMSVVSSTDVDAVDKFVADFMHPEVKTTDAGTGKCVSENWYSLAKEAYDALTTDQKAMFDTCAGYKTMKTRFDAWAKANPSQTGLNNVFYNDNNNNVAIYIGTGLALTSVAAMALLIINKKKKHSK